MNREIPNTLAETLVNCVHIDSLSELEEFRIEFEREHGPTDLSRVYSSHLPLQTRAWLLEHEPERYMDNLPPFGKAFLIKKFREAVANKPRHKLSKPVRLLDDMGYLDPK